MNFFFQKSPYYRNEPIFGMLSGYMSLKYSGDELDVGEYNQHINDNKMYECCVGFAKTHLCIIVYSYDQIIQQNIACFMFWVKTLEFKTIKSIKKDNIEHLIFYKNRLNQLDLGFELSNKFGYQNDATMKILEMAKNRFFV